MRNRRLRKRWLARRALVLAALVAGLAFALPDTTKATSPDTELKSPTAVVDPNDWTNPIEAFTSDDVDATATAGDAQGYSDFNFSISAGAVITGIEVFVEAHSDDADGDCELDISLSSNDGVTYGDVRTAVLTGVDVVYSLGGSADTWGATWSASDFSDANFVVKVTALDPNGCDDAAVTFLDHLQVNVYFKTGNEAGFESPSAIVDPSDWTDPEKAFASDNAYATSTGAGEAQGYGDFGLSVPSGAVVTGIEAIAEAASSDFTGDCELAVELSGDSGASYSDERKAVLTNSEKIHFLGGSSDKWGATWSASDFSDANLVVRVTAIGTSDCDSSAVTLLDHLQVNVYFKTPAPVGGISLSSDLRSLPLETDGPGSSLWGVAVGIVSAAGVIAVGGAALYARRWLN